MTKYHHDPHRSLEDSVAFFEVLGLHEMRRRSDERGRYTNMLLAAPAPAAISGISPMPWKTSTTTPTLSSPAA
jgi:hypothetical protein